MRTFWSKSLVPSILAYISPLRRLIYTRRSGSCDLQSQQSNQDRRTIEEKQRRRQYASRTNVKGAEHDRHASFSFQGMWIGSIMPLSALFGGIAGGPCIEYLGRRNTILTTALPFIAGTVAFTFQRMTTHRHDRYDHRRVIRVVESTTNR